jgi:hypothetical protein
LHDQLTLDGETERIPGVVRDASGQIAQRWVQIVRTTTGLVVHAPADVSAVVDPDGRVTLVWPE